LIVFIVSADNVSLLKEKIRFEVTKREIKIKIKIFKGLTEKYLQLLIILRIVIPP